MQTSCATLRWHCKYICVQDSGAQFEWLLVSSWMVPGFLHSFRDSVSSSRKILQTHGIRTWIRTCCYISSLQRQDSYATFQLLSESELKQQIREGATSSLLRCTKPDVKTVKWGLSLPVFKQYSLDDFIQMNVNLLFIFVVWFVKFMLIDVWYIPFLALSVSITAIKVVLFFPFEIDQESIYSMAIVCEQLLV